MFRTALRFPFWSGTFALTATGLLLIASIGRTQVGLPPPGPPRADAAGDEPGMETLTQGPIHEAFANPAEMDPTPGPVVPMEPPQPIAEEPPEYMPEDAVWIPGYWVWDDDRDGFLWVTGVARVAPPDMQWVPGYFADADGGWQRVSGFWASMEEPEVQYRLTGPPQTLEVGPSSPAPSEEHFWVPGNWAYHETDYRWQAGYWAPYQENWIWTPARWVWTPGGYVFCQGFWDYRMAYRGQMFAPVYFQQPVYLQPQFVYRPWCVIPTNNLFIHLWIRPQNNCYYFGNYYGPQFAQRGFIPWANLTIGTRQRYSYDPFYSYAQVHYRRQGVDYLGRVQGWHRHFAQHEDLRPPRTWRDQQRSFDRDGQPRVETQLVARTVVDISRRQDTTLRMVRLDEQTSRTHRQQAERIRDFNQERQRFEVSARQTAGRSPGGDRRGDGRDSAGRGDGKAGSLVDRAEGKAGRDDKLGGGRGGAAASKLTIPRDLMASSRSGGRGPGGEDRTGDGRAGDDKRGKAGNVAGRQQTSPPPRPRATSATVRDNNDKGGKNDRQQKDITKAADQSETPPSLDGRGAGKLADRDDTPGRGKAGDAGATARDALPGAGRDPTGGISDTERGSKAARDAAGRPGTTDPDSKIGRGKAGDAGATARDVLPGAGRDATGGTIDNDRGSKAVRDAAGRPGTPDTDSGIGRGKAADRADDVTQPGLPKGKAGGQSDRGTGNPEIPGADPTRRVPTTPGSDLPGRNNTPARNADSPDRGEGKTVGPRPDAGRGRPEGTITPGTISPDRANVPKAATPGADRTAPSVDRNTPGTGRGNLPGTNRGNQPGAERNNTPGADRGIPGADRTPPAADRNSPGAGRNPSGSLPGLDRNPSGPNRGPGQPNAPGAPARADRPDSPRPNPQATSPPGRGNEGQRTSPQVPRANPPSTRPDNSPDNRGKGNSSRGQKPDSSPDRTEAFRPTLNREAPTAAMPRVEPRPEARSMPRVEPPRETRPMPRVETARENRPAPRTEPSRPAPRPEAARPSPRPEAARPAPRPEAPRPSARNDSPRPGPSADRGSRESGDKRSEPAPPSSNSERPGGKGKNRDRDN